MTIKQLYLKNFRGYSEITIPFDDSFNMIIGKNDVGKSTILEALEIFFNNQIVQMQVDDLNVYSDTQEVTIGVSFVVNPDEPILLDETHETTLRKESLLNEQRLLEIRKVWNCSGKAITAKSVSTYLYADYYKVYAEKPLIIQKINELKKLCRDVGLNGNTGDGRVAADYRKDLYELLEAQEKIPTLIKVDSEDAKAIYSKLSERLPYFALFMSDRPNKDSDKEVQDPLKVITKQAIAEVQEELDKVVCKIQNKAIEKGLRTIDKLSEMNPDIAKELKPDVAHKNWDSLFSFSFLGDNNIPLNKRGSGVRRLIILNYFRAEAEDKSNGNGVVYAIEEPETSQHPDYQIMLMDSLMKLSQVKGRQVIITTHRPEFAKMASEENLIFLKRNCRGEPEVERDNKLASIREELGILPYLSKLVICVEGPCDVLFLRNINKMIPELKSIIDLEEKNISIIPLQGGNLKTWVDRNYLENSNVKQFHLYDRDTNSGKNTEQYVAVANKANQKEGLKAVVLERREMENYISKSVYEEIFGDIDFSSIGNWATCDIPKFIQTKMPYMKETDIKSRINGQLAKKMTKSLFEQDGTWDEVKGWFEQILDMYEG